MSLNKPWEHPSVPFKTEAQYWTFIRGVLRRGSSKYSVKTEFIKANRFRLDQGFYKNGKPKSCWGGECKMCKQSFKLSDLAVDHIIPAGSLLSAEDLLPFTTKLFCSYDNFQFLCKEDHERKSYADKYSISLEDALRGLNAGDLKKMSTDKQKAHLTKLGATEDDLKNKATKYKFIHSFFKITWLK